LSCHVNFTVKIVLNDLRINHSVSLHLNLQLFKFRTSVIYVIVAYFVRPICDCVIVISLKLSDEGRDCDKLNAALWTRLVYVN
jgi:hypothetical protein